MRINDAGDEWGFYIDVDNEIANNTPNNEDKIRKKYNVKKYNDCNDIVEEYEYHMKNRIDDHDEEEKTNYTLVTNFVIRVTSTTLITTAAITYFVFFVL